MNDDQLRLSYASSGNKFSINDTVSYTGSDGVTRNMIVTRITRVEGFLPTYYRVYAESGWYWCEAHERYFKFKDKAKEAAWLGTQQADH